MKKSYLIIFILFFISIFSYFFGGEFLDFHKGKTKIKENKLVLAKQKQEFSIDKIREIKDITFFSTPNKKLLENIVSKIDNSKRRVYVEVYMLTEQKLKDAIKRANKRGIDVKVIMEKNPYMAFNINNKTFKFLSDNKVNVVWSNLTNYSLNHSKFIILDEELLLASGNFTHSTFYSNRDIFLFIKDEKILSLFLEIFNLDFIGKKTTPYDNSLVISPDYSRNKLEKLLSSAKKNIIMYFPYLADDGLKNIIFDKKNQGINIKIITDKAFLKSNLDDFNEIKNKGIDIKVLKKDKEHAKAILIDGTYLYIGSENFSKSSLDNNRETGILLKNKDIIKEFYNLFEKDFK